MSCAGLVPVMALADRAGLTALAGAHLSVPGAAGVAAGAKVSTLVAGMVAGADSISDMDVLRHGAMPRLFGGVRAPSTLGTFLRAFRFGHVRQLDAVAARVLAGLARHAPIITAGEPVTYLDIDDTIRATFGYAKQGAGYGYSGVKGLNALLATVSSASSAPVIVATRLRKGSVNSARGAARLVADAIKTSRAAGVSGLVVLRADSAYYGADVIAGKRRRPRPVGREQSPDARAPPRTGSRPIPSPGCDAPGTRAEPGPDGHVNGLLPGKPRKNTHHATVSLGAASIGYLPASMYSFVMVASISSPAVTSTAVAEPVLLTAKRAPGCRASTCGMSSASPSRSTGTQIRSTPGS